MELDDLKKSWNALDEHLKNKEFIEEKEIRSEERRVGKECRSRWSPYH